MRVLAGERRTVSPDVVEAKSFICSIIVRQGVLVLGRGSKGVISCQHGFGITVSGVGDRGRFPR